MEKRQWAIQQSQDNRIRKRDPRNSWCNPMDWHSLSCVFMWCVIQTARDVRKPDSRRGDKNTQRAKAFKLDYSHHQEVPERKKISLRSQLNISPALPILFIFVSTSSGLGGNMWGWAIFLYVNCSVLIEYWTLPRAPTQRIRHFAGSREKTQNKMKANSRNSQTAMSKVNVMF